MYMSRSLSIFCKNWIMLRFDFSIFTFEVRIISFKLNLSIIFCSCIIFDIRWFNFYNYYFDPFLKSNLYSCADSIIVVTSFSRYFLKRSNLASEMTDVAFILIALGSSRTTPLAFNFLLRAWNLLSLDRNASTTLFSRNNLLTLLQPPFYTDNRVAELFRRAGVLKQVTCMSIKCWCVYVCHKES